MGTKQIRLSGLPLLDYLTYRTSQTHNKRIDALRRNPLALLAALNSKKPKRALLGIRACVQVVARLTKRYSNLKPFGGPHDGGNKRYRRRGFLRSRTDYVNVLRAATSIVTPAEGEPWVGSKDDL
jgi:hypothetical protein